MAAALWLTRRWGPQIRWSIAHVCVGDVTSTLPDVIRAMLSTERPSSPGPAGSVPSLLRWAPLSTLVSVRLSVTGATVRRFLVKDGVGTALAYARSITKVASVAPSTAKVLRRRALFASRAPKSAETSSGGTLDAHWSFPV